jgi:hypothetical protein
MNANLLVGIRPSFLLMRISAVSLLLTALFPADVSAKTIIFWQRGFPTVASDPVDRSALAHALNGLDPQFADLKALGDPATLAKADLLVLPYGSAFPVSAWPAIESYLHAGGNLLIVGGEPFRVPVEEANGKFEASQPQDTYSRVLDFRHTYEVPISGEAHFAWKYGYDFPQTPGVHAHRFFAVEGSLNGLGYMVNGRGELVAAPVIVADHLGGAMKGSRIVGIDFEPQPGYWQSTDGIELIHQSALYASQGATWFNIETLYSTLHRGESPTITVHVNETHSAGPNQEVQLTLRSERAVVDSTVLPVPPGGFANLPAPTHQQLAPGFYTVSAELRAAGRLREFYQNGFWVAGTEALNTGPTLGVRDDFLTRDGAPFFPVGTNYFTTEEGGWDFASPRNAAVWNRDFANMERNHVTFVRTGVWMPNSGFIDASTGGVNQRFLRNVEAFLLCAQRHNIAVNFTFFAFSPHSGPANAESTNTPPPNPYLDPAAVAAQQAYIRSVVEPFKNVPWLSWDLINEPSFSNPKHIWSGNYPNGDPVELAAWRKWLREKYSGNFAALARAWRVPATQLGGFDAVPLPSPADLATQRYGDPNEVRAVDYNLFAQDMFSRWVSSMVTTIRVTGSKQLIDVGQDEGGISDRLLNQFYGGAGVSFTTNHTYWQDDALLWDSVAAKRPGTPNIVGETGYQPVWLPDGTWRYDEFTGADLIERKWALGFAAGSSGVLQWDWAREPDFGMERSDGSAKIWMDRLGAIGEFAQKAAPQAIALKLPEVAIVLPQSLQLSVEKSFAIEAQQNAVRALYGYARGEAYVVGEYQIDLLGTPKLILLPSPMGLTENAWETIEQRVRDGAVVLVTGPFGGDAHLHEIRRQDSVGLPYRVEPLTIRNLQVKFPFGDEQLIFSGNMTTALSRASLPGGADWSEVTFGKGRILFSALPLELNDNLHAIGDAYRYAMKTAGVTPVYTTALSDPGILISPTMFPDATIYVVTSESNQQQIEFTDRRSGKQFKGSLASGRAAILLVGTDGRLLAWYNWTSR